MSYFVQTEINQRLIKDTVTLLVISYYLKLFNDIDLESIYVQKLVFTRWDKNEEKKYNCMLVGVCYFVLDSQRPWIIDMVSNNEHKILQILSSMWPS